MSLVAIFQCRSASTSPSRIKIRRRLLGRCAPIAAVGIAGGLLLIGMIFAPSAHASTYTWDGTVNDWFAAPSHWGSTTLGTFPGTTDDAKNLTAAAMTLGQSTTIQSFFSNGGFSLNGGTFTGSLASAAGTIQVNALFTLNGGQISNFTVQQGTGGSVVVTGSGGNQIIDSILNSNLDMNTNVNANVDLYGTVTENGAITLGTTSNGIRLVSSNTSLNIGSAGSLTGFGSVYQYNANTLNNGGTINANSAGNTLNINTTSFTNTGTAEVQNGAFLSVTGANTDSGNVLVSTGGTATFGQGLTQTAGTTQVDGTLNSAITLTGGTLKGTGTVVGNVVNNGGTIAPGDSPGKLSITGAFTQNSGTFSIEFNNTAHDLLAVSGLVTTGGILDVNYVGTGASTGVGSIFDILDYGSVATSLTGSQFFSNQGADGLIIGHDGFTYMLINDTTNNQLHLKELTAGNPVPETSSVVSLGLLLLLGGVSLCCVKRRATGREWPSQKGLDGCPLTHKLS